MRNFESQYLPNLPKSDSKMVLTLDLLQGDTAWIITLDDRYFYYGHPDNPNLYLQMSLGERRKKDYNFAQSHKAWANQRKNYFMSKLIPLGNYALQDNKSTTPEENYA